MWRRKQSRGNWGKAKENDLRKLVEPLVPAICRSARSRGLFDVWAIGRKVYLFQNKRTDNQGHVHGFSGTVSLLRAYDRSIRSRDAIKIVACYVGRRTRKKGSGWRFFVSETDYQKMVGWADGSS